MKVDKQKLKRKHTGLDFMFIFILLCMYVCVCLFFISLSMYVCLSDGGAGHGCHSMLVEVRRQFFGVGSLLLLLHGFWELNTGHQTCAAGSKPSPLVQLHVYSGK